MSFLKSKHNGWTWDLKRTPFGGGGGGIIDTVGSFVQQNVIDPISSVGVSVDQAVGQVPGGWGTVGALATGGALGAGALGAAALDAGAVASADGIALSTYGVPAAEAMSSYGATAAELGLPAATTAADVGAVAGTASAEFAGTAAGQEAIGMTAQAVAPAAQQTAQTLAAQLGFSDPIAAIAGGVNPADLGLVQSGAGGLSDLLGYAKTGAEVVGGLGKLAGGVMSLQAGQKAGQYAKQADPMAQYRSGYAAQLQNLINNPSTITTTPGYQFNLAQGLQAQQAQQAAQGRLVSGGGLLQAQQFGQQYAQSNLQQQQALLAQLSGATQAPASGAAAQAGLTAGQLGGTLGGIQGIASGLGNVINPLQTLYANYNNPSPSVA